MVGRREDELVQAILVSTAGGHEDTVVAAACASVGAWLSSREDPRWATWLSGPFAKTVRRVKPARLASVAAAYGLDVVEFGSAAAVAFAPARYDEFAREVAQAQVSGTDFARAGSWSAPAAPDAVTLLLNPDLAPAMSTGKTAAQAAHALMAHLLGSPSPDPVPPQRLAVVVPASMAAFDQAAAAARVVIADSGRTEIEPGSVTFVVV